MRHMMLDNDDMGTAYPPHPNSYRAHLMNGAARSRRNARAYDHPRYAYSMALERVYEVRRAKRDNTRLSDPTLEPKAARDFDAYVVMCGGLFFVADGFADLYVTDSESEANAIGRSINRHRARSAN